MTDDPSAEFEAEAQPAGAAADDEDPFAGKAEWFDEHYRHPRGRARLELVLERILTALPPAPADILDAGGGTGAYAIPLAAMGYQVTILDRSEEWLAVAERQARASKVRLRLVQGSVERADRIFDSPFDVVLCHTVLAYALEPVEMLSALRAAARPGALLSLLEKNRLALSFRPGLQGDYREALRLLDDPHGTGRLGIVNTAFAPGELRRLLLEAGWRPKEWAGIRVFSDIAPEDMDEQTFAALLAAERETSTREPYRRLGRLVHLLAGASPERTPTLGEVQLRSLARAAEATRRSWAAERALSPEELESFLERRRYGVLSTTRPDGRAHAAMVAFHAEDGRVWLPTMRGAVRLRNLLAEPAATLVVSQGQGRNHVAVVIEGDAVVHDDPAPILDRFLADAWARRHTNRAEWATAVVELLPTRVLSFGRGRVGDDGDGESAGPD